MVEMPKLFTIKFVARHFGVTPNAVRKWEAHPGCPILPMRTEDGGIRLYTAEMIGAIDRWRLKGGHGGTAD